MIQILEDLKMNSPLCWFFSFDIGHFKIIWILWFRIFGAIMWLFFFFFKCIFGVVPPNVAGFLPPLFFPRGGAKWHRSLSLSLSISTTGFRKWKTVRLSLPFLSLSPSSLSRWRRSEGRLSVLVATNSLYGFQRLQMLWICVGK